MPEKTSSAKEWKRKVWYELYAPPMFGGTRIGETLASDPQKLLGRKVEVSLGDLVQDVSKAYLKLFFQVVRVDGEKAYTDFVGHDLAQHFLRSQVRRRATKITHILTVRTKDGREIQITVVVMTVRKISRSQVRAIRSEIVNLLTTRASERTFDQFVQEAVLGKLSADVYKVAKKYCPIRRVEIQKTEVLKRPAEAQTAGTPAAPAAAPAA
ncbi:MAG: 30S ribosomal protein S3ae [Hadesarchaea archaeon]|nr:30S ribosomal protein S3ae [Hadesarchaea archaeon]